MMDMTYQCLHVPLISALASVAGMCAKVPELEEIEQKRIEGLGSD